MSRTFTLVLILLAGMLSACGKSGNVTIASSAFTSTGALASNIAGTGWRNELTNASTAPISVFKFCVRSVKLENEKGETEKKDDQEEIIFTPGLVDLSDGKERDWGKVEVPTGFQLSRIKIKVHKDKDLCKEADGTPADYSIMLNNATTSQDVEFKWKFSPAVDFADGEKLKLAMNEVVAALAAGDLSSMKEIIERTEGSAVKQ